MSSNLFEKLLLFWFSLLAFAVFYFILRSDSLLWDFILSEIFGTKLTPYSITNIDSWKPGLSWKKSCKLLKLLVNQLHLEKKNLENQIHYREIVITNVFFNMNYFYIWLVSLQEILIMKTDSLCSLEGVKCRMIHDV